jgi:hypothetical protein
VRSWRIACGQEFLLFGFEQDRDQNMVDVVEQCFIGFNRPVVSLATSTSAKNNAPAKSCKPSSVALAKISSTEAPDRWRARFHSPPGSCAGMSR